MIKASVIISFFNNLKYLQLVLAGFERQTTKDFEIIIADDGSDDSIVNKLHHLINTKSLPIAHVHHKNKGFRKNKILNQAVQAAASEYLIFIDGDCVPHCEFVSEHIKARAPRISLTGRRVNLSEKFTSNLSTDKIKNGSLEKSKLSLISDGIFGGSFDVEKGFYVRSKFARQFFNTKSRGLLGCNFSLYKDELLAINGFDERYEAPSIGEDSDVQFRLELNGVTIGSLNNIAVQYHLYHKLQVRPQKNADLFEQIKNEREAFTKFGIKKY